jgi:hypothetical protein
MTVGLAMVGFTFLAMVGFTFRAMVGFTSLGSTIAPLNSTLFSLALTCGWEISVL